MPQFVSDARKCSLNGSLQQVLGTLHRVGLCITNLTFPTDPAIVSLQYQQTWEARGPAVKFRTHAVKLLESCRRQWESAFALDWTIKYRVIKTALVRTLDSC